MNVVLRSASVLALASAALAASAQNLLKDPGFEEHGAYDAASYSYAFGPAWSVGGDQTGTRVYDAIVDRWAHSGDFFAGLGSRTTPSTLEQSIATVPGRSYTVGFYLANYERTLGFDNVLIARFGTGDGLALYDVPTSPDNIILYRHYQFTGTATSTLTTLSFLHLNQDVFFLDDVSVTLNPVPEPASMAALGLGVAAMLRRRKRA